MRSLEAADMDVYALEIQALSNRQMHMLCFMCYYLSGLHSGCLVRWLSKQRTALFSAEC